MVKVITVVNAKYSTSFTVKNDFFSSWQTFEELSGKGMPCCPQLKSWKTSGEHYVLLYGLDIANSKAYLGYPRQEGSNLTELKKKFEKVTVESVVLICK